MERATKPGFYVRTWNIDENAFAHDMVAESKEKMIENVDFFVKCFTEILGRASRFMFRNRAVVGMQIHDDGTEEIVYVPKDPRWGDNWNPTFEGMDFEKWKDVKADLSFDGWAKDEKEFLKKYPEYKDFK